jgi:hypothetical protein
VELRLPSQCKSTCENSVFWALSQHFCDLFEGFVYAPGDLWHVQYEKFVNFRPCDAWHMNWSK